MPAEVAEAMYEAAKSGWLVDISELLKKAGEKIAELCGAEAAFITSGATAGLTLSAAACMTGKDTVKMRQLPDTSGLRNEIIVQRGRFIDYSAAFRFAGARILEVGCSFPYIQSVDGNGASIVALGNRREDIEAAICDKTVAIAETESMLAVQKGKVELEDIVEIAQKHNIPTIFDAASELPPASNLSKFVSMGVDIVIFSGGKALSGPNNTGVILGNKELVEACALQAHPNMGIGRGFKVSKEDIVGIVVALERYVTQDFGPIIDKEMAMAKYICDELHTPPHIISELIFPDDTNRPIPIVQITLDENALRIKASEVKQQLLLGDPEIHVFDAPPLNILRLYVTDTLQEGDERIVVERVKKALSRID